MVTEVGIGEMFSTDFTKQGAAGEYSSSTIGRALQKQSPKCMWFWTELSHND